MKFSYSLIKKFAPGSPSVSKLADALNFHSYEVEEVKGDMMDIKLPPNRYSGAVGHMNIAREAAAIFNIKRKDAIVRGVNPPTGKGFVTVEIQNDTACPRYMARYFEIKKVGQSPVAVKKYLETCGINPINEIVDIMNLVMLETGQPLHAFDADKIADVRGKDADKRGRGSGTEKRIIVRNARKGEKFETLDKQTCRLDATTLVIADAEKALAIAGIKGGMNSGVTHGTKRIIVEAANFNDATIYKTCRALRLDTDASVRFKHGLSPALVDWGMDRATWYLKKAGAKLLDSAEMYPRPVGSAVIDFDATAYEKLIGAPVLLMDAKHLFKILGFETETISVKGCLRLRVTVPAWRNDLSNFEDLAEEVSRFQGYNELHKAAPLLQITVPHQDDSFVFRDRVRDLLVLGRLDEVYNDSFFGVTEVAGLSSGPLFGSDPVPVEVLNPIAEDKKYLRMSLTPFLKKDIKRNARFFDTVRIFEIGKVFAKRKEKVQEKTSLGIAIAAKKDTGLVRELKGIVNDLLTGLGIEDFVWKEEGGFLRIASGKHIVGQLEFADLGKSWTAVLIELDGERLMELMEETREFKPLSKFPAVMRDISVFVSLDARIGEVVGELERLRIPALETIDLIDEYTDGVEDGYQSLTFRLIFQADDRTLSDEEVNREMEKVSSVLKTSFKATVR